MAMCGCFVPAEYASFRSVLACLCTTVWNLPGFLLRSIHDALLTRLSNDDDMEKCLSTFANEMASSAMILGPHIYQAHLLTAYDQICQDLLPRNRWCW